MAQRIVVIGAGVVGAALAYRLAEAGAAVTILEAIAPAALASGRSFGWINASFFASPAHFRLREAAIAAHRRLDAELGDTGTIWSGSLWWDDSGTGIDALMHSLVNLDYPVELLTRDAFARLEPNIANPPSRSLMLASEAAVDAARLTERLLSGAANHGANLWLGCDVTGFRTTGGRVNGVVTAQGVVKADQVVIAAGVATKALLAPLGIAFPMLSRPGLMVCTRPLPPTIHHILISPHGELRQDQSGRILAPTAAAHQGDATETITQLPGDAANATMGILRSLLPGVDLKLEVVKMAHRPVPADGLPVVGSLSVEGLYVATMHSGVTLAPLIATLVRDEVLLGERAALLAPFRPQRLH